MSRIIREALSAPRVFIGEKHHDFGQEEIAVKRLGELIPLVSVITDSDGAKLIPIQEVQKIEKHLIDEREKSFKEGFEKGHRDGLQQGLDKAREVLQQLNNAINDAVSQRELLLDEARQQVLNLVMQVARKVTFDAIEFDPEKILEMINGVINTLVDRSCLKIKVNPDHLPILEQNMDRFLRGAATLKEIKIEGDPRVRYGGCFIETPNGDVDARLESQFEVIQEALNSEREKE